MDLQELFEQGQYGLHTENKSCIIENGLPAEQAIFQKQIKTYVDGDNGPTTDEVSVIHKLDCGHYVTNRNQVLGQCTCSKTICFRCQVTCFRCARLICVSCLRIYSDTAYCSRCRIIAIVKDIFLFSLRSLHNVLLREI